MNEYPLLVIRSQDGMDRRIGDCEEKLDNDQCVNVNVKTQRVLFCVQD